MDRHTLSDGDHLLHYLHNLSAPFLAKIARRVPLAYDPSSHREAPFWLRGFYSIGLSPPLHIICDDRGRGLGGKHSHG